KELIDGRGCVAWAAAHSAWGRVVDVQRDAGTAEVGSPFRLLGQYGDEETGLCYTRFRYFDAEAGRWCSPDPIGFAGGANSFSWRCSPTDSADVLGLACVKPLPNQLKGWYEDERRVADDLGIRPLKPGDPGFDEMVMAGPVKWAVGTNGEIGFIPKLETGEYDVKHSIIVGGGDALSAGTADIVPVGGGKYVATRVDRESGHYAPTKEHLPIGVEKMKEVGIDVPDDSVMWKLPWEDD
ncbi:MAG: RHS repeat-associated core domain-containing protein, partial [Myxococcales bacterium]|nr:RHS repeat-associated core domain-containing protein [Myxococcales bacterium]